MVIRESSTAHTTHLETVREVNGCSEMTTVKPEKELLEKYRLQESYSLTERMNRVLTLAIEILVLASYPNSQALRLVNCSTLILPPAETLRKFVDS